MKILIISPFDGGSHHAWASGYKAYSRYDVSIISLPDRFWKWRMHGGSVTLARRFLEQFSAESNLQAAKLPDVLLATDMLDLTTFYALTRRETSAIPSILYMHENQLTYPLPDDGNGGPMRRQKGERDLHYGFVNYASMLAANLVLFNSHHHYREFFGELPRFLKHFPEHNELDSVDLIQAKSEVCPVGVDIQDLAKPVIISAPEEPPLILWNQRWEYDKNPTQFFEAVYAIAKEGLSFRLAVCGENFRQQPAEFERARSELADNIVHWGFANLKQYRHLLQTAAITISTATHEFFGISIIEAIACETFPILPNRLSYPEIIPATYHHRCLYINFEELVTTLKWSLLNPKKRTQLASRLASEMWRFEWSKVAVRYDDRIAHLVGDSRIAC